MSVLTFIKPGINLIELAAVPVRYITDIGRIDVIDGKIIFTLYDLQPGEVRAHDAVVVDKVAMAIGNTPDAIQFVLSVLAQVGMTFVTKPLVLHS